LRNILIHSGGTYGDVFPFLAVGKELRRRGHRVTMVTNCVFEERVTRLGLEFVSCDTPAEYRSFLHHSAGMCDVGGAARFVDDYFVPRILPELKLLLDHVRRDALIITSAITSWPAIMAAERTGTEIASVYLSPSYAAGIPGELELLESVDGRINQVRATIGLSENTDWKQFLLAPQHHLAAWPAWFAEVDPSWLVRPIPVGFMHDQEAESVGSDENADRFINSGEPPVLISGGSSRFIRPTFYVAAAAACKGRRALLVAPEPSLVPTSLPPTIAAFPPLPFAGIVPRVQAVVHHGGYGISVRALASAKPQMILAAGADRPDNGRRLESLGVARTFEEADWDPERLRHALDELLSSAQVGERCVHWANKLKLEPQGATGIADLFGL